jgi:hypothetical protein
VIVRPLSERRTQLAIEEQTKCSLVSFSSNICRKLAVIFCALYAPACVMFCSNDCSSAEYAVYYFGSAICSG